MSYYKVKGQKRFLVNHLRGTGRTITASQAANRYGILNLSARISEIRQMGLKVTVVDGKYRVSSRDVNGSRAKVEV